MSERCPNRWMHGVMTCPACGNNDRGDSNVDALKHELDDWRQFGFAQCGPPITCDQDMRDGIEGQFRSLRSRIAKLEAALTDFRAGSERRLAALAVAAAELEARYSESQARVAELEAKDIESDWLDMSRCIREQRERIAKLEALVEAARRVNDVGASDDFCAMETALEQLDAKAELEKVEK